jgi:hypothetical protein
MPEAALVLLSVALGVAVAAIAAIVLRQTGMVATESRDATAGRAAIAALAGRADRSLGEIAGRIDQVRRGTLEATALADPLPLAQAEVGGLADEARGLRLPDGLAGIGTDIVGELERASRALDMVEHGRTIMTSARVRGRELEAQTAVKRGYLNLLHAREAIVRHAARAAAWRSPTEARRDARQAR